MCCGSHALNASLSRRLSVSLKVHVLKKIKFKLTQPFVM